MSRGIWRLTGLVAVAVLACANELVAQEPARSPRPGKAELAALRKPRAAQPIAIPQEFSPPQEAYASFPAAAVGAAVAVTPSSPSACQQRLAKIAVFKPLPVLAGPGECGATDAVRLESVMLADAAKVAVAPPATLRCEMAEGVALWLRQDVAAAALKLGAPLRGLDDFDSYECRGRNRVPGATLSEHGRANALDVRGFRLADGRTVSLTDMNVAKAWREDIRASACGRFSTVLGPGSDGNHEEHIHLDLVERRSSFKMCEWDVREAVAKVPDAKPAEAKPAEAKPAETKSVVNAAAALDEPVPLPRPRPRFSAGSSERLRPAAIR